jgi:hypothetical protein
MISNIIARNTSLITSSITGFPGNYVENVTIRNVHIIYKGGGIKRHHEYDVPENERNYPENRMFGHYLPSYGFYIRHVKDLKLEDIQLRLEQPDYRSVLWIEDVSNVSVSGFQADTPASEVPIFEILRGEQIQISDTYGWDRHETFLSLDNDSKGIVLMHNDLSNFSKVTENTGMDQLKMQNNLTE